MIVIVESAAAEGEDGKVDQGHENHDFPRIVFEQGGEVFADRRLLHRVRPNALSCGSKGDHEEDEAKDSPEGHGHLPAILTVMTQGKFGDQRESESADDELRRIDGDKTIGIEFSALVEVTSHDPAQSGI